MTSIDWLAHSVEQTPSLYPYVPGKPVEQLLRETGLRHAIKLASNENAYGPPPAAISAMQQAALNVHRYPDGDCTALKKALAEHHGIEVASILPGNGSNEVLELVIRCFAGSGAQVIFSRRAFIVYALATVAAGAQAVVVEDTVALGHDLQAMLAAVTENTRAICIANPNNPTGTLLTNDEIQQFLDQLPRNMIVIIDEAYHEYVAAKLGDSIHTLSHPGLVISRTFSKAYGLAGCRVGYAVADRAIVACINRFREPFNVNALAQAAALAALGEQAWVFARVADCLREREKLEKRLRQKGILGGYSHGNFVLLQHQKAAKLHQLMEQQGVILRPLAGYHMVDFLRVSVGMDEENSRFLQVLDQVLPHCND